MLSISGKPTGPQAHGPIDAYIRRPNSEGPFQISSIAATGILGPDLGPDLVFFEYQQILIFGMLNLCRARKEAKKGRSSRLCCDGRFFSLKGHFAVGRFL